MRPLATEKLGCLGSLIQTLLPKQRKINGSQPFSSWAHKRGGTGEPEKHCAPPPQKSQRRDTHSLLRLSRPVKAPLVSSIVPEISLWSRSLGRRQREGSPSSLSSRPSLTRSGKIDTHSVTRCPAVTYGQHECGHWATGTPFYTPCGIAWPSRPSRKAKARLKLTATSAPWAAPQLGRAGPWVRTGCGQHMGNPPRAGI